jgi:exonuclease VII small subunit
MTNEKHQLEESLSSHEKPTSSSDKSAKYLLLAQESIDKNLRDGYPNVKVTGYFQDFKLIHSNLTVDCSLHGPVKTKKGYHPLLRIVLKRGFCCIHCEKDEKEAIAAAAVEKVNISPSTFPVINDNASLGDHPDIVNMVTEDDKHLTGPRKLKQVSKPRDIEERAAIKKLITLNNAYAELVEANAALEKAGIKVRVRAIDKEQPRSKPALAKCEVHGNGWLWGTPWMPSISTLKNGIGCPKCAGRYRRSEEEMWWALKSLGSKTGASLLPLNTEYLGNQTSYQITCKKHGDSGKWGSPYSSKADLMLNSGFVECPKCLNHFSMSSDEKIEVLNQSLSEEPFKAVRWVHDTSTGIDDRLIMSCSKHGDSQSWGNPWNPTLYQMKSGGKCPKCAGNYKPTEEEFAELIEEKIANLNNGNKAKLTFLGFNENFLRNESRLIIECEVHGQVRTPRDMLPIARNFFDKGVVCQSCVGRGRRSQQQELPLQMEFDALPDKQLLDKIASEVELIKDSLEENNLEILDSGIGTKIDRVVRLSCLTHGDCSEWKNPWKPTHLALQTYLKSNKGRGCPKCAGRYIPAEQEVLDDLDVICKERNVVFHGFAGEFKNRTETKMKVSCDVHGNGWDWNTPWLPTIRGFIKSGRGCYRCSMKKSVRSQEDRIAEANAMLAEDKVTIIGVQEDFKGAFTKLSAVCSLHGNGWEWDTPWKPTFDSINSKKGCPKCRGTYAEPLEVLVSKAEVAAEKAGFTLNGFNTKFIGVRTKCNVSCKIHGPGNEMTPKWFPELRAIIGGTSSCRTCNKNMTSLNSYLTSLENGEKNIERSLYYIAFKHADKVFYKIGLATHDGGVDKRYTPSMLESDGVEIMWYKEVIVDNGLATLLEAAALSYFNDDRDFSIINILKESAGGTECFSKNIVNHINFKDLIIYALNNYRAIKESSNIYNKSLTTTPKKRLLEYVEKYADTLPEGFPDVIYQYNSIRKSGSKKSVSSCTEGVETNFISTNLRINPKDVKIKVKSPDKSKNKKRVRKEASAETVDLFNDEKNKYANASLKTDVPVTVVKPSTIVSSTAKNDNAKIKCHTNTDENYVSLAYEPDAFQSVSDFDLGIKIPVLSALISLGSKFRKFVSVN